MNYIIRKDPDGVKRMRWSEEKWPVNGNEVEELFTTHKNLIRLREQWLSSCDRSGNVAEVAKEEEGKFHEAAINYAMGALHDKSLSEGVQIPGECVDLRLHGSKDDLILKRYAYFREPTAVEISKAGYAEPSIPQESENQMLHEAIEKLIKETIDEHPYKQAGNRDSYSQYNEGWCDACDILGHKILTNLNPSGYVGSLAIPEGLEVKAIYMTILRYLTHKQTRQLACELECKLESTTNAQLSELLDELAGALKEIYAITDGAYSDPVIDENLYIRMQNAIQKYERFKNIKT